MKEDLKIKLNGLNLDHLKMIEGTVIFAEKNNLTLRESDGARSDVSLAANSLFIAIDISVTEGSAGDQIEISKDEIAEGDPVSIFFEGSRDMPIAQVVRKIVNSDEPSDEGESMGLDYFKMLSLAKDGESIIFDEFKRSEEKRFHELMKVMGLSYRLVDPDSDSDHVAFVASHDRRKIDDFQDKDYGPVNRRKSFFKETDLLRESKRAGLEYIELLSLVYGVKPMMVDTVPKEKKDDFVRFLDKNEIAYFFFGSDKEPNFTTCRSGSMEYFAISKDPSRITEFEKKCFIKNDGGRFTNVGNLLGYPECCSEMYGRYNLKSPKSKVRNHYYEAVAGSKEFHPFNSNIFCFYGKGDIFKGKEELDHKNGRTFLNFEYPFLISHMPCSFDCKESFEYGRRVYEAIKAEDPDVAEAILNALSKPILFFDQFNFVVFDGEGDKNEIRYKGLFPLLSLIDDDVMTKMSDGERITVSNDEITVFKGEKVIHTIKKKEKEDGFIIPFSR